VDLFILETFRDVNEIGAAIRAVRSICDLPIVAQMTTEEDGNSLDGVAPETFVPELEQRGADVVGLNCSVGPAAMLETIERMSRVAHVKLAAQPNAGKPREIEGRNLYLCSPEYMAQYARRFINAGVRLIGGCCGTTPEHVQAIKVAVRSWPRGAREEGQAGRGRRRDRAPPPRWPREQKSRMANTLARGGFVVSVELMPPPGFQTESLVEQAKTAADSRRGPGERARHAARERADERAVGIGADPAAGGGRDDPALRLPRSAPARHAAGSAGRAFDGRAQHPAGDRRAAEGRRLRGRHGGGARRRFDRPHERRRAAERGLDIGGQPIGGRRRFTSASRSTPAR
jgi:hypothetical protein